MPNYTPPFTISHKSLTLVAEISQAVGQLSVEFEQQKLLRLRKVNRMRTVQGSLAIEGNTLSAQQITAILDGKRIIAPPKEVQEAHNAIAAYEALLDWEPTNEDDLLAAHLIVMQSLISETGVYRNKGVGVMSGDKVIHMAPQAVRVPKLMTELLEWLATTDIHALIGSCVFHYEFEFIHPFADGNGRMGRLWQTLILSKWHPVFINIPVESLVHQHQKEYYLAIGESNKSSDASPFIEFMLQMISNAITESMAATDKYDGLSGGLSDGLKLSDLDKNLLILISADPFITNVAMAAQLAKSVRTIERRIKRLRELNILQRIGAKKTGYWQVVD